MGIFYTIFVFIRTQLQHISLPTSSFAGQTIIVTGANTGLGLAAATHLVRLNAARVILACRSISKGEAAIKSIEAATGRKGVCEVWQVDMGNWESIQAFCAKAGKMDRIDVVMENAGVNKPWFEIMEGWESTVAVNVIGTFLMALNLLPVLRSNGKRWGIDPRLVITSSDVHGYASFAERHEEKIFEALNRNEPKYMGDRYMCSKLLEVFTVRELAAQIKAGPHASEPLVLNTVNPGLCYSELSREWGGLRGFVFGLIRRLLARTSEVGGGILVSAAAAGTESHGRYISESIVKPVEGLAKEDKEGVLQRRVYGELTEILEQIQPGITKNI